MGTKILAFFRVKAEKNTDGAKGIEDSSISAVHYKFGTQEYRVFHNPSKNSPGNVWLPEIGKYYDGEKAEKDFYLSIARNMSVILTKLDDKGLDSSRFICEQIRKSRCTGQPIKISSDLLNKYAVG